MIIKTFSETNFSDLFEKNEFVVFFILHGDLNIYVQMSRTGEINFSRLAYQLRPSWRYDHWIRSNKKKLEILKNFEDFEEFEGLPVSRFVYRSRHQRDLFLVFPLALISIDKVDPVFCLRLFQCYKQFLTLKI
jgi:hypothetical protein